MKSLLFVVGTLLLASSVYSQTNISFGGQAVQSAPGLTNDQTGVLLVDFGGLGFDSLDSLEAGLSTTDSATYGSGFYVLTDHTVAPFLTETSLSGAVDTFVLGDEPFSAGDSFAYLVYTPTSPSPYTTTSLGDSFAIWTDPSWTVPTATGGYSFGSDFDTLSDSADFSGTVIPESSAYATIFGLLGLGYAVFCRRRRSSSTD